MPRTRTSSCLRLAVGVVAAVVALVSWTDAWSQSRGNSHRRGQCLRVELPGPLVMPDGSTHDATMLRICFDGWFSPVSGTHVLYVDGHRHSMLLSRVGKDEAATSRRPIVVFERNQFGRTKLIGYAWPSANSMVTHHLHRPGAKPVRSSQADRLLEEDTERLQVAANIE